MPILAEAMSVQAIIAHIEQHPDTRFDFTDGELVEVGAGPLRGWLHARIGGAVSAYMQEHPIGTAYNSVIYSIRGVKFLPDISINRQKQHDAPYFSEPPLLAVEIRSDTQSRASQRRKAQSYLDIGAAMVWLVMPDEQIEVYTPDADPVVYGLGDTLDGGAVLPGFQQTVRDLIGR